MQLALEVGIVFDDAVVNDGHQIIAADVGVGIVIGSRTVRGPARMADALAAGGRLLA
jgi:hypothetical protein